MPIKCSSVMPRGALVAAALVLALANAAAGQQRSYTFRNVADDAGELSAAFGWPVINNAGVVAFHTNFDGGGEGILTGTGGGPPTVVARTGRDGFGGTFGSLAAINDNGAVALVGSRNGTPGIYSRTAPGATPTLVTTIAGGEFNMNNAGDVAFANNNVGVFLGNGGPPRTIYGQAFRLDAYPHANNNGTVAFAGGLPEGTGVYVGDGSGAPRLLVGTQGPFFGLIDEVSINDRGDVAFRAWKDAGGLGIYVADIGGTVRTVADDTTGFGFVAHPSINKFGEVVFRGRYGDNVSEGLYVYDGAGTPTEKVIEIGDTLFGSRVNFLDAYYDSINDDGTIAFNYGTEAGRMGVAVAVVPEPATLSFALVAAALLRRRPARRRM